MKERVLFICLIFSVVSMSVTGYLFYTTPKVAFIRNAEVIQKYKGVSQASQEFESKMLQWEGNLKLLQLDYDSVLSVYSSTKKSLTKVQQVESERSLQAKLQNIQQYSQMLQSKSGEEQMKVMQGAYNQINSFIEEYAKSHGYDYVLGTTKEGNLMYANAANDITDDVIVALNNSYSGK